jgi:hypothetical protein
MTSGPVVIRLPRTSYLVVVFLVVAAVAVAFGDNHPHGLQESESGTGAGGFELDLRVLVFLVPIAVAVYIARTATIVSSSGLRVRAMFGSRDLPWESIRGLLVSGRAIYAALDDGAVRLPCVRLAHLGPLSRLSEGRLPELPDATPKPAPARRRRA